MPNLLTSYFRTGDAIRSRSVGDLVLFSTLDVPVISPRLMADCEREISRMGIEPGDVEELSLARARARWPHYSQCVQAVFDWTHALGLPDVLGASDVALMVCRGARYHHDGAQYGAAAFCNLFLSDDKGLDLHFPCTGLRIPLTRGTAVVFDTGQPHAVIQRHRSGFDVADFPRGQDCTLLFLTWEIAIEDTQVGRALGVTFDNDPATAMHLNEEQVWRNGAPAAVCPHSGRWQTDSNHAKPVVHETLTTKSLLFSIDDLQSCMDLRNPDALTLDYTQLMMGFLLFQPQPRSIAMIGLGGGSLAKFCHANLPATRMTVVEINPHVLAVRDTFCIPPDGDRFRVVMADGAAYVCQGAPAPDVLLVDGYDVGGLPAALSSQRFYDDCFQWLDDGGLMVANLHLNSKAYPQFVERIQHSFQGNVRVVQEQYGANCIVFARKGGDASWPAPHAMTCPAGFDMFAWLDLQPSFAHLRKVLGQYPVDTASPTRPLVTAAKAPPSP